MLYQSLIAGLGVAAFAIFFWSRKNKESFLKGKVVLIVGASSGIGKACAEIFYKAGCKLILCSRRLEELEEIRQRLLKNELLYRTDKESDSIKVVQLDIMDNVKVQAIISESHAEILINNAGVSYRGSIEDTNLEVHKRLMEINYFGLVASTNAILPSMIQRQSGHVVFISSLQGKLSIPFRSAYSASKHALQAFADCLRAEMHKYGIKVTVISPSYVQTALSLNALHGDGSIHGEMDSNQRKGMSAYEVAQRVLVAVEYQHSEVLIAKLPHRMAVYFRNIFPKAFFALMNRRALEGPY